MAAFFLGRLAAAQTLEFPSAAAADPSRLAEAMPVLARQVIAQYGETNRERYLNNLFRAQLVAGEYSEALKSIRDLRETRNGVEPVRAGGSTVQHEVFARAKLAQTPAGPSFAEAFQAAFRERFGRMDDQAAVRAASALQWSLKTSRGDLQKSLDQHKDKDAITLADALDLLWIYQMTRLYESIEPLANALLAADDQARYLIESDLLIPTREGASVSAILVRPRKAAGPLPTAFEFTIYANEFNFQEARKSAAFGFAGLVANTRGKRRSPGPVVPYERDGEDASAVIDWISKQPWSNGRVGMFGGSYDGFSQWAAAKRRPPALKSIMPSVPVAPGIDVPKEGNIFLNFTYKWIPYVTNNKGLDEEDYNNEDRWSALDQKWFASGKPYRALPILDGRPNKLFERWLDHPSYDKYWQAMIPYRKEFSRIDIPVLTTTGYYDGCSLSARYYFGEHTKYNPRARHYFVIGPYDHIGGQRRSQDVLQGYRIDPAAKIDIEDLRYQWLDHTLRGGPKPALLVDRVNFEVMGGNIWKHAPSIEATGNGALKLYLGFAPTSGVYSLSDQPPAKEQSLEQRVDLKDRTEAKPDEPELIVSRNVDARNGFTFVSAPFKKGLEVTGLFSGRLDLIANKRDLDLNVALYEVTPQGEYFFLSYFLGRASYLVDRTRRSLLVPGQPRTLSFTSGRMTSRRLEPGSRLAVVLSINKRSGMQLNYGTGNDVSDESIADAGTPLEIKWLAGSLVSVPVWRD